MSLDQLRARLRFLSIPAQAASLALRLAVALLWVPMWAGVLSLIDELWWAQFQHGIGWSYWGYLWVTAGARVAIWLIDEFLNLDQP